MRHGMAMTVCGAVRACMHACVLMRRGLKKRLCDAAQDLSDYVLNSLMYDAKDAAAAITARLDVSMHGCMPRMGCQILPLIACRIRMYARGWPSARDAG